MSKTTDHAIQGFLYQFNKTLLEILKSPDEANVIIEGIVENMVVPRIFRTFYCSLFIGHG